MTEHLVSAGYPTARPRRLRRYQAINAFDADFDLERMLAHEWSPIGTVLVVGGARGGKGEVHVGQDESQTPDSPSPLWGGKRDRA